MTGLTVTAVLIVAFGLLAGVLHLHLAARRGRKDRLLSLMIALVCLVSAGAWAWALYSGRLLGALTGRSIMALALAALTWLGLARGGRWYDR